MDNLVMGRGVRRVSMYDIASKASDGGFHSHSLCSQSLRSVLL